MCEERLWNGIVGCGGKLRGKVCVVVLLSRVCCLFFFLFLFSFFGVGGFPFLSFLFSVGAGF